MFSVSKYNLCRLCLCVDERLLDIFEESYNVVFLVEEVIKDLLQFEVVKEVGLPWLVCSACLKKLTEFRLFKSRCIECKVAFENRYKLDSEYASCGYCDNSNKAAIKSEDGHSAGRGDCSIGQAQDNAELECIPRDIGSEIWTGGSTLPKVECAHEGNEKGRICETEVAIKVEQEEDCGVQGEEVSGDATQGHLVSQGTHDPRGMSGGTWNEGDEILYPKVECVYEAETNEGSTIADEAVNEERCQSTCAEECDRPVSVADERVHSETDIGPGGSGMVVPGPYVPTEDLAECIKRDKRKYICELCGERFLGSQSLRLHVANHETDSFLSKVVEEKTQHKMNWKVLSVHGNKGPAPSSAEDKSEKRTYPCDICERNFYWPTDLKRHKRTHDGSKPYKCEHCDRAFALKSNLIRHRRIHVNLKPFPCRFCKKSFSDKCNMNKHEKTHMGLKSYKCALCSKGFSVKDSLKTHLVGIHKLEGKEQLESAMILPTRKTRTNHVA